MRFAVAVSVLFSLAVTIHAQENYSLWADSSIITINTSADGCYITDTLYGFPYFVRLSQASFNFSQALKNGEDIRFANPKGAHLPYEIEQWDSAGQAAAIWVKVDTIRGNDSVQSIKMYWGRSGSASASNGAAVFDTANKFKLVYHLNENPSGGANCIKDRTINSNNGTPNGGLASSDLINGYIGKGLNLNSSKSQYLVSAKNIGIGGAAPRTVSFWMNTNDMTDKISMVCWGSDTSSSEFGVFLSKSDFFIWGYGGGNDFDAGPPLRPESGIWLYITALYDGATAYFYVNGNQIGGFTHTETTTDAPVYIGDAVDKGANYYFTGQLDEIEISNAARSAGWIKLCYENQRILPSSPPVIRYPVKHIFIPIITFADSIIPSISGAVDSLTITPYLPGDLIFNPYTGVITGAAIDVVYDAPFYITAYNPKGSSTDTIYLTIGDPSGVHASKKNINGPPRLIGLVGSRQPRILFFAPSAGFTDFVFTIYDLKGTLVWSSRVLSGVLEGGIQSVPAGNWDKGRKIARGMYFIEMKAVNNVSGKTCAQRSKVMLVQP